MLDEMFQWWASKLVILLEYENPRVFFHSRAFNKGQTLSSMKQKLLVCRFSYSKSMANFESFRWNISSSIKLLFLKSSCRHRVWTVARINPKTKVADIIIWVSSSEVCTSVFQPDKVVITLPQFCCKMWVNLVCSFVNEMLHYSFVQL